MLANPRLGVQVSVMKYLLLPFLLLLIFSNSSAQTPLRSVAERVDLKDYNVTVVADERVLVMMAALNLAGYDYEPDGSFGALRRLVREELASTDADLVSRLRAYYASHRSRNREEVGQIAPYIGLALVAGSAPGFVLPVSAELPPDVVGVKDFLVLLREFYAKSQIAALLKRYAPNLQSLQEDYSRITAEVVYETINYLHTQPLLFLPNTPRIDDEDEEGKKRKKATEPVQTGLRVRRLRIYINPLAASGLVLQRNDLLDGSDQDTLRRVGDEYFCVVSEKSLKDYIRYGLLRFVLDPLVGKRAVEIANLRERIVALLEKLPNVRESARRNVYEAVGESLARAASVRILARSLDKDEATYLLSQYYEQGAVLVFHFHDGLQDLERVGIDIRDYIEPSLKSIDFEKEAHRLDGIAEVRARVEAKRSQLRTAAQAIIEIDSLISERKYAEARLRLEALLKVEPHNARALFGLAQVYNNQPSPAELDTATDDDEKIAAQEERLVEAVKLYREAITNASTEERWMVSQCHVFIGRILDFAGLREAAVAEYEKAIKLGEIPKGAYKEALEGKARPYNPRGER